MQYRKNIVPAFFVIFLFFLIPFVFVHKSFAASCAPAPSGLVSWWGGDNNALDMVGTNNGTLMNGATYAPGMVGQAFSFDGNNQYAEVPEPVGDFGSAAFSVDFWMYTSDPGLTSGHYILGKSYPDGGQGWDVRYYNRTITVEGWSFEITSDAITLDDWHHVAVSATASDITLYIDGVVKGTSGRPASITSTTNPFRIGYTTGFWPYSGVGFNGLIDEVEIFNRALDATEIAAIYNAGNGGKCRICTPTPSGAVSLWKAENNANDSVGSNNGTFTGEAAYEAGKVGKTFSFDGVDDYVSTPLTGFPSTFTASAWINYTSGTTIFGTTRAASADNAQGELAIQEGANSVLFTYDPGASLQQYRTDASIVPGAWTHIAVSYTYGNSSSMKIYINGELQTGAWVIGDGTAPEPSAGTGIKIGATLVTGYPNYFNGLIDEAGIFNRALSAAEVAAMYNSGIAGTCPSGMVSWWKANNDANDSVGTHHGTMQNGATFASGVNGQAFSLDGGNDNVDLGNWVNYQSFTIEMWVNPGAPQKTYAVIFDNNHTGSRSWALQQNATVQNEYAWGTNDAGSTIFSLPANQWTHLVVTRDESTKINAVYLNSVIEGSYTGTTSVPYDGTQFLRLGTWGGSAPPYSDRHWKGLLDDVRVYNRALTAAEINSLRGPDATPTDFTFADQTDAAFNSLVTSNTIIVSGINIGTDISITGGEYQLNGGSWTSSAGTIFLGDTVAVRQTTGSDYLTTTDATLTIGSISDTFSVTTIAQCALPVPGLIAWWKGENNANDSVGANNGTLQNGATYAPGKVGQAFSFDGVNDFADFGSNSVFEITDDITIDAWVKVDPGETNNGYILGKNSCVSDAHQSYMLYYVGGKAAFFVNGPSGSADLWVNGVRSINDGQWHHIAGTFSKTGGAGNLKIYVDGVLDNQATTAAGSMYAVSGWPVTSGGGTEACAHEFFNGLIDEMQIYSRALSVSEIAAIYNAGGAGVCAIDRTPVDFTFTPASGVQPGSTQQISFTVSGINFITPISITGGEYAIGGCGGTFTTDAGTVSNGDTVCVEVNTSLTAGGTTSADLTVGGITGTFTATTIQYYARVTPGPKNYSASLTDAYAGATLPGDVIEAYEHPFDENLDCDGDHAVTLNGGYNPAFDQQSGWATVKKLTISGTGSLTVSAIGVQ